MAMYTVIVKNSGGAAVEIADLGCSIGAASQKTLSDEYSFPDITSSDDLFTLASVGTLVINDGSSDLSTTEAEEYLTLINETYVIDNYYSQTELSTSGQSSIHWDNITNTPAIGSAEGWYPPVLCRVLDITSSAPAGGEGDFYIDTDDDHLYKYVSSAWVDQGAVSVDDRFINIADTEESIYECTASGTYTDQGAPDDNWAVFVGDDGDGKQSQYIYLLGSLTWVKIADVDLGGHIDGGSSKHDASEIDVESAYSNIGSSADDDLETVINDIDTALGSISSSIPTVFNTLDESYDEGGSGAGRVITADNGAVKIDSNSATTSPFEIVPMASAPSVSLAGGQFHIDSSTGILYCYDATRSKWLSVNRFMMMFGESGSVKDRDLAHYGGSIYSRNSGLRMIRDACIVGAAGQIDATGTCNMRIRSNDSTSNLATIAISATLGGQDGTLDVNLSAGDFLQSYLEATTAVEDPVLMVELAWRL